MSRVSVCRFEDPDVEGIGRHRRKGEGGPTAPTLRRHKTQAIRFDRWTKDDHLDDGGDVMRKLPPGQPVTQEYRSGTRPPVPGNPPYS